VIFSLEALEAKYGDCLILHWGTKESPHFILIDGGPPGAYKTTLDPRLDQLQALSPDEPLRLELVVVSHIDEDHIDGILALTGDLVDQHERALPLTRDIRGLWHNSFDDIVGAGTTPATVASLQALLAATAKPQQGTEAIVASVPQGRLLRDRATALSLNVNRPFEDLVLLKQSGPVQVEFPGNLTFHVLSPCATRVRDLQKEWDKKLKKAGLAQPSAAVAALLDKSVYNLSSIVVLATAAGGTILLTGDARGDDIIEGLNAAKLLDHGPAHFNILKMPHHGSSNDVDGDFFRRVKADYSVFSANGKYENPDLETLRLLTAARGADAYSLCFTNHTGEGGLRDKLDDFFAKDRLQPRNYTVRYRDENALSLSVHLGTEEHL
jgi:hypothetical protein